MSTGSQRLRVRSPGKINLELALGARRADGYHDLDTTMLAVDRGDALDVRRMDASAGIRLRVGGPAAGAEVPVDASNLAVRAARAVLEVAQARGLVSRALGLELELEKCIPSRAGLGGGSSNAAAAVFGVARLLGVDPDDPELRSALGRLGSDCSFFLEARGSGLARCRGRGERVVALEPSSSARCFVVITPDFGCSTAEVYAALRPGETGGTPARGDAHLFFEASIEEARSALRNDLEAAALRRYPELIGVRRHLDRTGAGHFRLCGSGSSFFGLFEDEARARVFLEGWLAARKGRDYGLRAAFAARPAWAGVAV